jgi:hypothetical protein
MKYLIIILFALFTWTACQETPEVKAPESPQVTQAPPPTPGAGTNQTGAMPPPGSIEISETELVGMGKANIDGSNVTMRKDASIQSEKVGTFEDKEPVAVLESKNVQNEGEAILSKPISVKGSGGTVNLPKGKAVVIEDYKPNTNTYLVTYEDPKKGKLTAEIDAKSTQTIIYATWFKVKRSNGETAWVLGKFLKFK